jgi:glycosyltransferase involved in cell wall biosynthesis
MEMSVVDSQPYAESQLGPVGSGPDSSDPPEISVIVMAYRKSQFLAEALASVASQSLARHKFEVILVTSFVDSEVATLCRDLRVRCIQCDEGYVAEKTRIGIVASAGEIVTFLDYDDMYTPSRLETLLNEFQRHPRLGFYRNGIVYVDSKGQEIHGKGLAPSFRLFSNPSRRYYVLDEHKRRTDPRMGMSRPDFCGSAMALRRAVALAAVPTLERIKTSVDSALFYTAWAAPFELELDSNKLTRYRIHEGNTSAPVLSRTDAEETRRIIHDQTRASDIEVLLDIAERAKRPELVQDLRLREFRDRVGLQLGQSTSPRREAWALAKELPSMSHPIRFTAPSIQAGIVLAVSILSPFLGRALIHYTS